MPKKWMKAERSENSRMRWVVVSSILLPIWMGGCSSIREELGLTKQAPDEFRVVARAPLSMPPDYNLRPPVPGAPRPQEGTASARAASVVFGGLQPDQIPPVGEGEGEEALSSGEASLLQSASVAGVDPNIRTLVDSETAEDEANSRTLAERLIFWRDPEPFGEVVDPAAEQKRLQENAALGKPVTEGETPVIVRKKRGLLEGIF